MIYLYFFIILYNVLTIKNNKIIMIFKNKSLWFTFVEIIVVITILIVLSSIWFISYTSYLADSRNTKRISNLNNVYDLFQLSKTKNIVLPLPDSYVQVAFSGEVLAYQWYLSWWILKSLDIKDYLGKDPKYWDYYTYYLSKNWKYFQFMWYMEEQASNNPIINKTYALLPSYSNSVLVWDPLWIITDKDTNRPIQDFFAGWTIDFATDAWTFIININDSMKLQWWNIDLWKKLNYLSDKWAIWSNTWALDANCMFNWIYVKNWESIIAYSEESILWNASYNCDDRKITRVCNDWVFDWSNSYIYISCSKWIPDNCSSSWSYIYNNHTYSIPALNHAQTATNINSSNVSENNWTFYYTIANVTCNDWVFNISENVTPTVVSCNSGYYPSWSSCLTYVNWACTSLPANAWYHNNTTSYTLVNAPNWTTLSATTAWYNASPTANTCQYKCNSLSYWWWSSCLTYVNWACTSLPANAWYHNNTTSYTLVNAPNWTTLSAVSALYNASPVANTCQYKCQTWYYWNWSSCVLQWSGDATNWFSFINTSWVTTYPTSCNNLLTNTAFQVWSNPWNWTKFLDWVYWIDPDWAWAITQYKVHCDMTTDWWWWTLTMKFRTTSSTFWYDSTYWTSNTTLNTTDLTTTVDADAKYQSFYQVNWNIIKLCMVNSWLKCFNISYVWKPSDYVALQTTWQFSYTHWTTAVQTIANNFITTLWFTNSWEIYCNWQHTWWWTKVRIWINKNDLASQWCNSSDDYARWFWLKVNSTLQWAWYVSSWGNTSVRWYIQIK